MNVSTLTFHSLVEDQLRLVEKQMRDQGIGHHPDLAAAFEHIITAGGKRVRPMVALLTGKILGGSSEKLITLAAAIELLHTATLVHDDLIDGALLRRGMATINAMWTPAATVLTGDFVFARAAKLAADTDSVKVMQMFAETLTTIVNGEINQYFTSRGIASREDYYQRIYAKTASMFELATGAAAVLSPVSPGVRAQSIRLGYELGMAFQIMDDILDYTGEQAKVGKPVANDLRQGLITLPALYYFEENPTDSDMLAAIERSGYSDQTHARLVSAIRSSGAIEKSLAEAQEYIERAQGILRTFPPSTERQALADLAHYVVDRRL